jgi:NADH-quinone oxidoreductase subunit J
MSLFVVFGAMALGAAIGMVLQRNAVHAALLLVVHLLAIAVLFLALGAEFLFVSQIIVYAGAIVVLFLFVIMLLGVDRSESLGEPRRLQIVQVGLGLVLAVLLVFGLASTLRSRELAQSLAPPPEGFGSARAIGEFLFQSHLLPFELTALLLLVATIGILMLAKRTPR